MKIIVHMYKNKCIYKINLLYVIRLKIYYFYTIS